jgi:hypothetical protein
MTRRARVSTCVALFFDPARRYAGLLEVPEPWSLDWVEYPFVRAGSEPETVAPTTAAEPGSRAPESTRFSR